VTRIVRSTYRYKRPPRKQKPNRAALAMPKIVTVDRKTCIARVAEADRIRWNMKPDHEPKGRETDAGLRS
jgi:hypothetical protein